jgi:hypothetical protein
MAIPADREATGSRWPPTQAVCSHSILQLLPAEMAATAEMSCSTEAVLAAAEMAGQQLRRQLIGSQEDGFAGGLGFQSLEFTITANGVEILDSTFRSLSIAESFFHDSVIDLGSDFGPDIDLTFGYKLVADWSGGFGFDFAVGGIAAAPETSTWAMMLLGFAGIGYVGYRRARGLPAAT